MQEYSVGVVGAGYVGLVTGACMAHVGHRVTLVDKDAGRVLAGIDVIVVPSRWYENAPGVIFESFAAKAPVVAANLGGMSEFVWHEENGLLFEPEDAEDLGRGLRRLAGEPGLLERLRSGIGPVKTIGEYTDELVELYASLLREASEA